LTDLGFTFSGDELCAFDAQCFILIESEMRKLERKELEKMSKGLRKNGKY
jgi:hypothetical protein